MPAAAASSTVAKRQRLVQRRKALGLTQEAMAELVTVGRSTVVRWERGESEPLPSIRPRLARALNQGRRAAVHAVRVRARGGDITIAAKTGRGGADLEIWAAGKEVSYFREVFGRELLFKLL